MTRVDDQRGRTQGSQSPVAAPQSDEPVEDGNKRAQEHDDQHQILVPGEVEPPADEVAGQPV